MKTYRPAACARHVRVPAFSPVPLRCRNDGWTPRRQAAFLAALALTGCVAEAARRVKMSRETAYRLRGRPGAESFAAAWHAVLGHPAAASRKVTSDELARRALYGLIKPVIYGGRHVGTVEKADNSALLGHLAQLDRAGRESREGRGRSRSFSGGLASPSDRRER